MLLSCVWGGVGGGRGSLNSWRWENDYPLEAGLASPWEEKAHGVGSRLLGPTHSPLSGAEGMLPFLFQTGS